MKGYLRDLRSSPPQEEEALRNGQLDLWDYDGCCGDGRHALDALYPEPPDGSSETGLPLQARGGRKGKVIREIFREGEYEPCGKRLQVDCTD